MTDDPSPPSTSVAPDLADARHARARSPGRASSTPWPTACGARSSRVACARARACRRERELSLALGVNRLTLRASLARLEALGLITTRHGAGTVVASWRERAGLEMLGTLVKGLKLADPAWHELVRSALELRRILAAEAVALAAERHTDEDIDAIATCVAGAARARRRPARLRPGRPGVHARGLQGGAQRRPRALPQHVRALARRAPAARDDALRRHASVADALRRRSSTSSSRATARRRARIARRALEALDAAWARRHPSPGARRAIEAARELPSVARLRSQEGKEAMKLARFEDRWAEAAMGAIFPGSSEAGLRRHPRDGRARLPARGDAPRPVPGGARAARSPCGSSRSRRSSCSGGFATIAGLALADREQRRRGAGREPRLRGAVARPHPEDDGRPALRRGRRGARAHGSCRAPASRGSSPCASKRVQAA